MTTTENNNFTVINTTENSYNLKCRHQKLKEKETSHRKTTMTTINWIKSKIYKKQNLT